MLMGPMAWPAGTGQEALAVTSSFMNERVAILLQLTESSDGLPVENCVVHIKSGRPQFYDLPRNARLPAYVAFDLLWLNVADLRRLPLAERRGRLRDILPKGSAIITEALSGPGTGHKLFELMCAHDLEGIVAKRLTDSYRPSARWLKIKNPNYSQNEGRRETFDKSPRRSAAGR